MSIQRFIDNRDKSHMQHIQVKPFARSVRFEPAEMGAGIYDITRKVVVQIIDIQDQAIVEAIVECAKANDVDDIYLLDKKFVLDALREKMARERKTPYE